MDDDARHSWARAEPETVCDGVHRLALPLPVDGLHAVNVYVIEDSEGLVVVDSGWANPNTQKALERGLGALGHRLADVAQFVVTHAHWDHYTQAVALRRQFGTRVRIGRGEQPTFELFAEGDPAAYPRQSSQLVLCGALALAREVAALQMTPEEREMPFEAPDGWLDDGEKVELAQRTLEVVATPGHTRGHIVLRDVSAGLLFAGDHVLPHITPSIGLERAPERLSLRSYLDSLALMRDEPDLKLLPAHGPVTSSVHTRVDELLLHHERRLAEVLNLVREGRDCAYEIATAMRWTRREWSLDEMDLTNRMLAVLEIQAHLDVLDLAGEVVTTAADPVLQYSAR
jgi:glyoxylase-like metal-dependent hydrolase (beta-lactamase superfamily II)